MTDMSGGLLQAQGVVNGTEKASIASLTGQFTEVCDTLIIQCYLQASVSCCSTLSSLLSSTCSWALRRAVTMKAKPLRRKSFQNGHARMFAPSALWSTFVPQPKRCDSNGMFSH